MSPQRQRHLKSVPATPAGPDFAEPAPAASGSGAPRVVAVGVPIAVLPDLRRVTVTAIQPGLSLRGLDRNEIPVADWLCACGYFERARGRKAVTELTTRVRVGQCPHHVTASTRRSTR